MGWTCFMVHETGEALLTARRYEQGICPNGSYHDASNDMGRFPDARDEVDGTWKSHDHRKPEEHDPIWPTHCECGFQFTKAACSHVFAHHLYTDGTRTWPQRSLPPGAMYEDPWAYHAPGPDGVRLAVVLPPEGSNTIWHPDSPSSTGGAWQRSGVPPKVTITPSILTGAYHGFLTDGVLSDSLPDRPLP